MQSSAGEADAETGDRRKITKLVQRSGSVLGCLLESVENEGERRILAKLTSIMDNSHHPLH